MENNIKTANKAFGGHDFKKSLGQNFLKDKNLLKSIVNDAGVTKDDVVIEVGAGAGTLTEMLIDSARAVMSFEVDLTLEKLLEPLKDHDNFRLMFWDALKVSNDDMVGALTTLCGEKVDRFKVVANIPYYITSPLIFKFLSDNRVDSITMMVQKEVAERIVALPRTKEYGVMSVLVSFYGKPEIMRIVKKDMFYPSPKVDSAVIKITKHKHLSNIEDEFIRVVKASFASRRKTLLNNLHRAYMNIDKLKLEYLIECGGMDKNIRPEELTINEYVRLTQEILRFQQR